MKRKLFVAALVGVMGLSAQRADAAALKVNVPFEGQAPAAENVKAEADPKCKMMHPDGLASDSVIVNSNGTLKNVFVYVKEGLAGKTFEAPKDPVVFDQKGCQYSPKVFGIMVKQPLEITNSDDTLHNVHAVPTAGQGFNLGMPIKGMKLKKTFDKPEVMVKIKCEVHPWMAAYAGVLEHPYYAVTGEDGAAVIKDLPAGEYTIEIWHEKYGTQTQKVTVGADDQEIKIAVKGS